MPDTILNLPRRLGAALLAITFPVTSIAAETVEELVITGQFRERSPLETPASVAVLDDETVAEAAVQHFEELSHLVPNLNWAGGASRPRYFQIRGIGERSQYEGAPNPSVGFLVDDIDFSALGGLATLFDVDQVEVLRGPQGTRYGANALAGLIYVRTRPPSDVFDARVNVSAGSDGTRALGAALGGPINDQVAWRAVAHRYESNGFRDNPFLGRDDTNGRDEFTSRLKLRVEPADGWRVDLTGLYTDLDNGYDAFAIDNGLTTYSDRPGEDSQQTLAAALDLRGALSGGVELVSITTAARSDVEFSFDADWGNDEFWDPFVYDFFSATTRDRESLGQELRLVSAPGTGLFEGRVDWVVGASVLDLRESNFTRDDGDFEGFGFASSILREYSATSSALFGDLDVLLADGLSLNAGLRFERRSAEYRDSAGDAFAPDENNVGGQLALLYVFADNLTGYARLSRGYKAGGFNLGLPDEASTDELLFDGEYLWNYELGVNALLMDGRLALAATAFWMEREDQQVQTSTQLDPDNPATFIFFTDNAGEGRNAGVEVTVDYAASDRLSLYAALGLLDTEIERFGSDASLEGRDQAHAPNYTFALGGRIDFDGGWFARLDVTGKDAFYFSDSHDQKSEAYTLVNARIGFERERWAVYAWGRNLFDEDYAVRGFFFGNEPARDFVDTLYVRRGDPRHYGVSFEYGIGR